jgi:hypothetical protein
VELPIDNITEAEARQYERFRLEYLGLWRQYFDPIGMRFKLTEGEVKVDTYILPLIENSQYNELRRVSGGGSIKLDASRISPNTLMQFVLHLSPGVQRRGELLGLGRGGGELDLGTLLTWGLDPVGKWALVRVDDSPVYEKLVGLLEKAERGEDVDGEEIARLVFEMPIVLGVDIKNPVTFAATLAALRTSVMKALPGGITWEPLEKPYKGVPIVRITAPGKLLGLAGMVGVGGAVDPDRRKGKPFEPAIYYAMLDGGFYLTLNEKMLHDVIDQAEARKNGEEKTVEVNSSLYLSPAAAKAAGQLLQRYFESRVHEGSLANHSIWYALHRCGVIPEHASVEKAADAAYQYLGFVPISPDGSPYKYDAAKDEVVNERNGSLRKPTLQKTLAEGSPLARLLEQLKSVRADLRFREDGIHTVLTIERQKPAK